MMPRKLTRLRIDEVSSCSKGAAPGARVLIRKRDGVTRMTPAQAAVHVLLKAYAATKQERTPMSTDIAKINQDYALAEQAHALKMFPESKSVGEALAKWHRTPAGQKILSGICRKTYEDTQIETALGDADVLKRRNPENRDDMSSAGQYRVDNQGRRRMAGAKVNPDDDDNKDEEVHTSVNRQDTNPSQASFSEKVASLMEAAHLTFDQACTRRSGRTNAGCTAASLAHASK